MNAYEVLNNIDMMLNEAAYRKEVSGRRMNWEIGRVYDNLGIFDWWNETLSVTQLKQMRDFLEFAVKHGFAGYVCFKVGAKYCSHGMWACRRESETGYSPNEGACLYHSFRSGDNYFDLRKEDGTWVGFTENGQVEFTKKEIEKEIKKADEEKLATGEN